MAVTIASHCHKRKSSSKVSIGRNAPPWPVPLPYSRSLLLVSVDTSLPQELPCLIYCCPHSWVWKDQNPYSTRGLPAMSRRPAAMERYCRDLYCEGCSGDEREDWEVDWRRAGSKIGAGHFPQHCQEISGKGYLFGLRTIPGRF